MDHPFFSVMIPVYNQEKYISVCIESVLRQSFCDYEIILVDDGSTDQSGRICDQYAKQYPSQITVIHGRNKGLFLTRCRGLEIAKGKYYLFLDSDDCFAENLMERIYCIIQKNAVETVIFNASPKKDFSVKLNHYPFQNETMVDKQKKVQFLKAFCGTHIFNNLCFKCIHNSLLRPDDFVGYEKVSYGEDLFLSVSVVDRSKTFYIIQDPLYFYRQHAESTTHNYAPSQFESIKIVCSKLIDYGKKWGKENSTNLTDEVFAYAGNECYRTIKNIVKSDEPLNMKKQYILDVKNDPFYKIYITNFKMVKDLKIYEKLLYRLICGESEFAVAFISWIFRLSKLMKRLR